MDLVAEYALLVPVTIIAEMLGVPSSDYRKFQHWSNRLTRTRPCGRALLRPEHLDVRPLPAPPHRPAALVARDDLLSALIQAEEAGDKLTPDELVSMVFLLLVAGHETTVNLIAGGTLALLQHPEQLERLRKDPALIEPAVEELLRYASPVEISTERFAREEFSMGGVTIPPGELVFAVLASANHDERQFKDPDTLDLGREPNKHVSFGMGIHYCLGAPLARLEGQIAIQTLVNRFPNRRLAKPVESLKWRTGFLMRGAEATAGFVLLAVGDDGWSSRSRSGVFVLFHVSERFVLGKVQQDPAATPGPVPDGEYFFPHLHGGAIRRTRVISQPCLCFFACGEGAEGRQRLVEVCQESREVPRAACFLNEMKGQLDGVESFQFPW